MIQLSETAHAELLGFLGSLQEGRVLGRGTQYEREVGGWWYHHSDGSLHDVSEDIGGGTNDHVGFLWAADNNGKKLGLDDHHVEALKRGYGLHVPEDHPDYGNGEWGDEASEAAQKLASENTRVMSFREKSKPHSIGIDSKSVAHAQNALMAIHKSGVAFHPESKVTLSIGTEPTAPTMVREGTIHELFQARHARDFGVKPSWKTWGESTTESIVGKEAIIDPQGKVHEGDEHDEIAQTLGFKDAGEAYDAGHVRYKSVLGTHHYSFHPSADTVEVVRKHVLRNTGSDDYHPNAMPERWEFMHDSDDGAGYEEFDHKLDAMAYLARLRRKVESKVSMSKKDFEKEHRHLVRVLRDGSDEEQEREADDQEDELRDLVRESLEFHRYEAGFIRPDGTKILSPDPSLSGTHHRELAKNHGFSSEHDAVRQNHVRYGIGMDTVLGEPRNTMYMSFNCDPVPVRNARRLVQQNSHVQSIAVDYKRDGGLVYKEFHKPGEAVRHLRDLESELTPAMAEDADTDFDAKSFGDVFWAEYNRIKALMAEAKKSAGDSWQRTSLGLVKYWYNHDSKKMYRVPQSQHHIDFAAGQPHLLHLDKEQQAANDQVWTHEHSPDEPQVPHVDTLRNNTRIAVLPHKDYLEVNVGGTSRDYLKHAQDALVKMRAPMGHNVTHVFKDLPWSIESTVTDTLCAKSFKDLDPSHPMWRIGYSESIVAAFPTLRVLAGQDPFEVVSGLLARM